MTPVTMKTDAVDYHVVVVGMYGVGKSSFVKALCGGINYGIEYIKTPRNNHTIHPFNMEYTQNVNEDEIVLESGTITIDNEEVRIVDTATMDVWGTQRQMQKADLVIVLLDASSQDSIDDLEEYWMFQFNHISLYTPIIACFNQIDRLSSLELHSLKEKFSSPTKEHFVLEAMLYVSAYTLSGINECKLTIINTLRNVRLEPRWLLINPYTWKLQERYLCALRRIFRLLDKDCDEVLSLEEMEYFNSFTAVSLKRLREQNDVFVTPQGLTFDGFKYLMRRSAIAKKWDKCWDVLRFYDYQNDLTLHPRVFPTLPIKEHDQTFELTSKVYILLEKLFVLFADNWVYDGNKRYDLLTRDGIKKLLSVLPKSQPGLHCKLLNDDIMEKFETEESGSLTKHGWLTFWAMFAVENAKQCFKQLTYLDLSTDTNRQSWYTLTRRKSFDHQEETISRSVIRILLFGASKCGKTTFCNRLLGRMPSYSFVPMYHLQSTEFRTISNQIGVSSKYIFLSITEVPSSRECIKQAIDYMLPYYDMIVLMFDLSLSHSFYDLDQIFNQLPKNHSLPICVLASNADSFQVEQRNSERKANYDINASLNAMGLHPYLRFNYFDNSFNFPALYDELFFIGTNPHYGRLKKSLQYETLKNLLNWKTIMKRTMTIVVCASIAFYSTNRMYKRKRTDVPTQPKPFNRSGGLSIRNDNNVKISTQQSHDVDLTPKTPPAISNKKGRSTLQSVLQKKKRRRNITITVGASIVSYGVYRACKWIYWNQSLTVVIQNIIYSISKLSKFNERIDLNRHINPYRLSMVPISIIIMIYLIIRY